MGAGLRARAQRARAMKGDAKWHGGTASMGARSECSSMSGRANGETAPVVSGGTSTRDLYEAARGRLNACTDG